MHIEDPAPGDYDVTCYGDLPEDFRLESTCRDEDEIVRWGARGYRPGSPSSFVLTFDPIYEPAIAVTPSVQGPDDLLAQPCAGTGEDFLTCLSWTAPQAPDVAGYAIYAFLEGDSIFTPLDAVASGTISYQSTLPWSSDSNTPAFAFAVTATDATGMESFFSNVVLNNDRDSDKLTDADEIAAGTIIDNPDSDGDGILDGVEIALGANLSVVDTDGDGYRDGDELRGDSDLLDDQCIPFIYIDKEGVCSGKTICRSCIWEGIETAEAVGKLVIKEGAFSESIVHSENKYLSIANGYDELFEDSGGTTTVLSVEISNGVVVVSGISVGPE